MTGNRWGRAGKGADAWTALPALKTANAKATRVMPGAGVDGGTLRHWRMSREWTVRRMARELIRAARDVGETVATLEGLKRMINAWERDSRPPSELYVLLYRRVFPEWQNGNGAHPPDPAEVLERARQVPGRAEIAALQLAAFRSGRMDLVTFADKLLALQRQVDDLTEELKRDLGEAGR